MPKKYSIIKDKNFINNNTNLTNYINEKVQQLQNIIRNTIISIKSNKIGEIFSNNDTVLSISVLLDLYEKTKEMDLQNIKGDNQKLLEQIQKINDKLLMIICGFGTKSFDDLLYILFGFDYQNTVLENNLIKSKFELIRKHIQPIGCKIINWKSNKSTIQHNDSVCSNKITEDMINIEESSNFECFDIDKSCKSFYQKIFGLRVVIHNEYHKKTIIINGLIDDIQLECFSNDYITYRINKIKDAASEYENLEKNILLTIVESFSLKDILVLGDDDINKKMIGIITEINIIKQNKLETTIKKFLDYDPYLQRSVLITLLTYKNDDEIQYLCYILNDLILSNNSEESNNLHYIYDSLPYNLKKNMKNAIKYTVKYTNEMLQKYDLHKITLEQQIYLMKANDVVKEKAIAKLKEIKSRSDETGLKAKQYLEGLLKIPFNVYREEPILKKIKEINKVFNRFISSTEQLFPDEKVDNKKEEEKKEKYSIIEIIKTVRNKEDFLNNNVLECIEKTISTQTNKQVLNIIHHINTIKKSKKEKKLQITNKSKKEYIYDIINYVTQNKNDKVIVSDIFDIVHTDIPISLNKPYNDILQIKSSINQIELVMNSIENVLDESIYSHKHAKNQIMKIIAQWMNGEQTGYCFGFEGCPGIGKTSLAKKGLSNCLKDDNGEPRPFAFIALGGSSNGSMLEGHGYTYLNSSWGRIVDILMETKCMNPIIYIDELDKVSKTENGKEIIGIFTHLIDSTQNDKFQDKYFSGIDIDLSKALFIFSYNDPDQIDRVLLDRIHRIKFDNLTLNDKLVIVRKFIIPEINKKMGFENIVEISDEVIEFIILNYTMEPGVRKLKEIFFDLFGEINLSMLKTNFDTNNYDIPIIITKENIENNYLKKYDKIKEKKIHSIPKIGIINGLWANQLSGGGIIPIQTTYYPSSTFLELKLTGLQGDVMKESMNVAKSLAWNLTEHYTKTKLIREFEETKQQGLHIHCPDGSISKDGPSAGTAITVAIYSLLNKMPIKNTIAITGEICLSGEIRAIGGLENKINGGIRSGIKTFLYPKENNIEFIKWKEKDDNGNKNKKIKFIEVSNIHEVLKHVFE